MRQLQDRLSAANGGESSGPRSRLVLVLGNERAVVHVLCAVDGHALRLIVQAMEIFCSRISADLQDRKAFRPHTFGKFPLRVERDDLVVRIRHDDHPSAWLMLHGCDVINRVVQSFDPRINFPTAVARPRLYRDVASCHNGATNIGARLRKSGDGVCPARLPGQMKTFQVVTELQFVECRSNDTDFEQGSSLFAVVTHRTKRPQTSDGDVGSAIDARPALYIPLHPAGCHKGSISIEAARRFGVSQITMDKNDSFVLRAASRRYPITDAIAGSINSHPDRAPQRLALRFIDGNAASENTWRVQRRVIAVRRRLRYFVLILEDNRIISDAAGAVGGHR